jgi:hypothetical protein
MRVATVAAIAVAGVLVPSARCVAGALRQGSIEFNPSVSFSHSSYSIRGAGAGSSTVFQVLGFLGYSVTERFAVYGNPVLIQATRDPGDGSGKITSTEVGLEGGVGLNLPSPGGLLPYARAGFGFVHRAGTVNALATSVMAPRLELGVRAPVGKSASVNIGIVYDHLSNTSGVDGFSTNTIAIATGVSVFPKGGF